MKRRVAALVLVAACATLALAACSTQARAERKGKQAADQICKAKDAGSANAAQRHLRRANRDLNDLARFTGHDVREDVRDIDRNLNQMSRGNATQQDVSAIVNGVQGARSAAHGNAAAAYDGMLEGLAACD